MKKPIPPKCRLIRESESEEQIKQYNKKTSVISVSIWIVILLTFSTTALLIYLLENGYTKFNFTF